MLRCLCYAVLLTLAATSASACSSPPPPSPSAAGPVEGSAAPVLPPEPVAAEVEAPTAIPTWFLADRAVALPPTGRLQEPVSGTLTVRELAGSAAHGPLQVQVSGPFEVDGSFAPLQPHEVRTLTVRYTGPVDKPVAARGQVLVTVDDGTRRTALAALVSERAPRLPVGWFEMPHAHRAMLRLKHAPFPHKGSSYRDGGVLVSVPHGFDPHQPYAVLVHIHGFEAHIDRVVDEQRLESQLQASDRQVVLVVPQGPPGQRDSYFGKLHTPFGLRRLVTEVQHLLYQEGRAYHPTADHILVSAHSGGFRAAARMVQHGGLPIRAVFLFDALYAEVDAFAQYAIGGGTLRSVHVGGTPTLHNRQLALRIIRGGRPASADGSDAALASYRVTIEHSRGTHRGCMYEDDRLARWLRTLDLPLRPRDER